MASPAASTITDPRGAATASVGRPAFEELSEAAHQAGVSLPKYVSGLVSTRALEELSAPSLTWLAVPSETESIPLALTAEAYAAVKQLCDVCGQKEDTVLSNLAAERRQATSHQLSLGFLRTEPGKGRIFGMYFEIAGFQYALLRHLAGDSFPIGRVLDAAFVSLAGQTASTGLLNDRPISQTARQFASKMVMIENRRRVNRVG